MTATLIVLVGLPGAGKSTFYRTRFAATHEHVSKDALRGAARPERQQQRLVDAALERGQSVVVDNTNATVAARAPLIASARARGAAVVGCYFDASVAECRKRNRQRQGTARVPDVAIYACAKRLAPPSYAEGFDALFRVGLHGDAAVSQV